MSSALSSSVNVANFVSVRPCLEGGKRNDFKMWEEQMLCLLESQDVAGLVNGDVEPPMREASQDVAGLVNGDVEPPMREASEQQYKEWRRRDRLVKGWILGSIGEDALAAVWGEPTARATWLQLHRIFQTELSQDHDHDQRVVRPEDRYDHGWRGDSRQYTAIYKAAQVGDWDIAENFFQDINELSTTIITPDSETALHVAVLAGGANDFVMRAVEKASAEALALKDSAGRTALHNAAVVGNTAAARALAEKNPDLLYIMCDKGRLAVHEAAINCQRETLEYLISQHEADAERRLILFEGHHYIRLLKEIIASQYVDVALCLVHKYPKLTIDEEGDASALPILIAAAYTLFRSRDTFTWWQNFIYHLPGENQVKAKKAKHQQTLQLAQFLYDLVSELPEREALEIFKISIMEAAKYGVSEIVEMIIEKKPSIIHHGDPITGMNVFMLAAKYRYENVFNLIYNMSDRKYMIFDSTDNNGNNLMHVCGKLAPPHRRNLVAGAALQMQREIQWFKEVEKFVNPSRRTWLNREGKTPQVLFTEQHEELRRDGERWMKETSNACTIGATLIATVMFAAAFTAPGGTNSDTGDALYQNYFVFNIFVVSDAISLFTSIASLHAFLSIVTSRYAQEDFMYLTRRLRLGMLTLCVSITCMLFAFSAALYLVPNEKIRSTLYVILLGTVGLPTLGWVQFPLIVDFALSNYGADILGKRSNRVLY